MIGSKQRLAMLLSKMKVFDQPDTTLEQYPTDSEVAAAILWDAKMHGEIEEKLVADFGCGTGILGIGALALGAKRVIFIELDAKVFPALMANLHLLEQELKKEFSNYEIIQGNIENYHHPVDVVIQNPPFGTQEKHADLVFLKKALALAPVAYSLHKTSTIDYLRDWARANDARVTHEQNYDFPLKLTMAQHTKRIERIAVSCLRFQV